MSVNRALTTNDDLPFIKKHQNATSGSTALSGDIRTMDLPANFYAADGNVLGFPYGSAWEVLSYHYENGSGGAGYWAIEAVDVFTGAKYLGIKRGDTGWQGWKRIVAMTPNPPTATNDSAGIPGDFAYDDNALYLKVSTGWKRINLLGTITGKNHFIEVATSNFDNNNQTNVRVTAGYFKRLPFPNVVSDTETLWDSSNFWYTAPEAGQYVITTIFRPQDGIAAGKRYGQGAGLTASDSPTYLWSQTNNVSNGSYNQRIMSLTAGQQVFMNVSLDGFDSYVQAGMTIYKLP